MFNCFDYSFQDINFILRDLDSKGLINIKGSNIEGKQGNLDFSKYCWNKKPTTKQFNKTEIKSFNDNSIEVKKYLDSKGLNIDSIEQVYIF